MKPYYDEDGIQIFLGDCREVLPQLPGPVDCCVTSPPYYDLRFYGDGGIGNEVTLTAYLENLCDCLMAVHSQLSDAGTMWLNLGDSFANDGKWGGETGGKQAHLDDINRKRVGREKKVTGLKPKDLCGVPWRAALALQELGWWLRLDIIWHKPNVLPESVTDRPTRCHEYIFLLSKAERYYYDQEVTLEPVSPNTRMRLSQNLAAQVGSHRANGGSKTNGPMKAVGRKAAIGTVGVEKHNASFDSSVCMPVTSRNKRSVWTVPTGEGLGDHTSTFPPTLILPCVLAGTPADGVVLDPFCGTGTTLEVAKENGRRAIGIEIEERHAEVAARRLAQKVLNFG